GRIACSRALVRRGAGGSPARCRAGCGACCRTFRSTRARLITRAGVGDHAHRAHLYGTVACPGSLDRHLVTVVWLQHRAVTVNIQGLAVIGGKYPVSTRLFQAAAQRGLLITAGGGCVLIALIRRRTGRRRTCGRSGLTRLLLLIRRSLRAAAPTCLRECH